MEIRRAREPDAPLIARLVNAAYEVEGFFVAGDRTSAAAVREAIDRGTILVAADAGAILGSVFVEIRGPAAYFGMLAVDPAAQGQGIGRLLIAAAEEHARNRGSHLMEITVVNLRRDLLAFYARLGYTEIGTAPYEHRPVLQPCHFIRMARPLGSAEPMP
jgi:GNAT superfamily N-acetyltransferase